MEANTIPLEQLVEVEGRNARRELGDLADLQASIKVHGMLQPIVVEPADENGNFRIVAGHRRAAAARGLGLSVVPVTVSKAKPDAATLVENVQRVPLNAVEEAEAFERLRQSGLKVPAIAKTMSVSRGTVDSRLALLALPDSIRSWMALGTIPLGAVPMFTAIMEKAGPEFTEAFAGWLLTSDDAKEPIEDADGAYAPGVDVDWAEVIRTPGEYLTTALEHQTEGPLTSVIPFQKWNRLEDLSKLGVTDPELLAKAAEGLRYGIQISEEDVDAARSYGALLEFSSGRYGAHRFLADKVWLFDRLPSMLASSIEAQNHTYGRSSRADSDAPVEAPDDKKKRLDAARKLKDGAALANSNLGALLQRDFRTTTVDLPRARLLARLLMHSYGGDMAHALTWVLDEGEVDVEVEKKDGTKATKKKRDDKAMLEGMHETIDTATKPGQIIGLLMQGIVAMMLCDWDAAPTSARKMAPWQLGRDEVFIALLEDQVPEGTPERMTAALATIGKRGY